MRWIEGLTLVGLMCGLALFAETFRPQPMWLNIRREPPGGSPSQRRWIGAGIALSMAGQFTSQRLEGDTPLWAVAFALAIAGLVLALVVVFRKPTAAEQQRRAEALRSDGQESHGEP